MRSSRVRLLGICGALAVAGGVAACDSNDDVVTGPAARPTKFVANMSAANENVATPITTGANGTGTFTVVDDTTMSWSLTGSNITGVRLAHIHIGSSEVNGGILVDLVNNTTPTGPLNNELIGQGQFHSSNIKVVATGRTTPITLDSLRRLMEVGVVYANVHTSANGGGEMRGQIRPAQ